MAVVLKCPLCREKFKYDIEEGWPDFCPRCGKDINNRRDDDDVVMPNILSFKTKNNDKVARDIMDGSEKRVEMAAAMAGVPQSEMSALKVTDLNDRNDALFSAKDVSNPVTQQMELIKARGGQVGFGATQAAEFAANSHTGVAPNAGLRSRNRIQNILPPMGRAPLP